MAQMDVRALNRADFVEDKQKSLNLNLKAGIASTPHGPILFLIWWLPHIVNGRPLAFYEQVLNLLNPQTSEILGRVADQTHLHVVVIDVTGKTRNLFGYKNTFGFGESAQVKPSPQSARERKYTMRKYLKDLVSAEGIEPSTY